MARFEALHSGDPRYVNLGAIFYADGQFGYLRARRDIPGHLSNFIGIDPSGRVGELEDVAHAFAEKHLPSLPT